MPTVEYQCPKCGHAFRRVILIGEPVHAVICPKCRGAEAEPLAGNAPLFGGIALFSDPVKNTD